MNRSVHESVLFIFCSVGTLYPVLDGSFSIRIKSRCWLLFFGILTQSQLIHNTNLVMPQVYSIALNICSPFRLAMSTQQGISLTGESTELLPPGSPSLIIALNPSSIVARSPLNRDAPLVSIAANLRLPFWNKPHTGP